MKNTHCLLTLAFLLSFGTATAQTANRFDIVIDEIFADPTPTIGLPNAEFIELKNVSATAFNLNGWRIGDGGTVATITANFILKPDSFVVLCANSAVLQYSALGTTIGLSNFPSLDNDGETLLLRSKEGRTIHAVSYTSAWYNNAVKSVGGWSLEMTDTRNPCTGAGNWQASEDAKGGTPGKKNSVDGLRPDESIPALLRAFPTDSLLCTLVFSEPLDSAAAAVAGNYLISDGIGTPLRATVPAPLFDRVNLSLARPLQAGKIYTITTNTAIKDCSGNTIGAFNNTRTGMPVMADSLDIVVNEILFNPKTDGYDYVECFNRSQHIIDLKQLLIANRNSAGIVSNSSACATETRLFFPGDYLVLTESGDWLQKNYLITHPEAVSELSLPSFPDDKGIVVLLNQQGRVIDELRYNEDWHFALLNNKEGIALERLSVHQPAKQSDNWHSAASTAGYGTPTRKNSQLIAGESVNGSIEVQPAIISPDNDGIDDMATIRYQLPTAGYVASVTIYDIAGRPVRFLARNSLLGNSGAFRWDGLGEQRQALANGAYIVLTDLFNLEGKRRTEKQTIIVYTGTKR
jgi:Lamin Tail Domain/Bacterial Ig-like domain